MDASIFVFICNAETLKWQTVGHPPQNFCEGVWGGGGKKKMEGASLRREVDADLAAYQLDAETLFYVHIRKRVEDYIKKEWNGREVKVPITSDDASFCELRLDKLGKNYVEFARNACVKFAEDSYLKGFSFAVDGDGNDMNGCFGDNVDIVITPVD